MKKTKCIGSELICPECYNIFPIMRKAVNQREKFHKKDVYCIVCEKVTTHIEVKDRNLLEKELEYRKERTQEEAHVYKLLRRARHIRSSKCQ